MPRGVAARPPGSQRPAIPLDAQVDRLYKFLVSRTSDARERIIESALSLVHERGYEAMGIAELCESAGVNKGSFYHFFRSKQALGLAVVEAYWDRMRPLFEALRDSTVPAVERLDGFFEALRCAHQQCLDASGQIQGCMLGNLALELSTRDELLRTRVAAIFELQHEVLEALVRELQAAGEIPARAAPAVVAGDLLAYVEGLVLLAKAQNSAQVLQEARSGARRLLGMKL